MRDYDLAATLTSGQAFRWAFRDDAWHGVVHDPSSPDHARCVSLRPDENSITARTVGPVNDWRWLTHYLQTDLDLSLMIATFPDDEPLRTAVNACRGLRLLRQPPWECLASFILSSTKQIVQIRQIVSLLCERFGEPISAAPADSRASTRRRTVSGRRSGVSPDSTTSDPEASSNASMPHMTA